MTVIEWRVRMSKEITVQTIGLLKNVQTILNASTTTFVVSRELYLKIENELQQVDKLVKAMEAGMLDLSVVQEPPDAAIDNGSDGDQDTPSTGTGE
jgi:hypothetical protein